MYTPDPDTVEHADCGVCGNRMEVKRGCKGSTSSIMAMCGSERTYDFFFCPHREEDWHLQLDALKECARKTPSGRLQKLYLREADEVLKSRKATKKVSKLWRLGI